MYQKIIPMFLIENVDEAIKWYKDVLNAKIQATDPENPPFEWASLLLNDVEIMFADKRSAVKWYSEDVPIGDRISNFIAYIYVKNADRLYKKIKDKVRVIMQPTIQWYGVKEFAIKDPFGIVLIFAQTLKK